MGPSESDAIRPCPRAIPFIPGGVPDGLRALPRWVAWKFMLVRDAWTKVPVNPGTGQNADSTDLSTWGTFDDAVACSLRMDLPGVGFVFCREDGFAGIDLDECLDEFGRPVGAAREIIEAFGSYCEVSPSGKGVKIFIRGNKPAWAKCKSRAIGGYKQTEVYSDARFFTVTGQVLADAPRDIAARQEQLDALCLRLWKRPTGPTPVADVVAAAGGFPGCDKNLLDAACTASNGEDFRALYVRGDLSKYNGDWSSADLGLCCRLAFWTGRDAARMDVLFRGSALYRSKWDRKDYRDRTIQKAIEGCPNVYGGGTRRSVRSASSVSSIASGPASADDFDIGPIPLGGRDERGRLFLSPFRTLPTAKAFMSEFYQHPDGQRLWCFGGELYAWRGNRFERIEEGSVRQLLAGWLHGAMRYVKTRNGIDIVPFDSNPTTVNASLKTICDHTHLAASTASPSWLCTNTALPPAREILVCRSINLHLLTGTVLEASPALFTLNSLEFDYEDNPDPPELWLKFIGLIFGDDLQSMETLQEWFGYCLIADTSLQKLLLMVGPRRSGKGTIGRVLEKLIGPNNVVAPTTGSLAGSFGLQPLIGKSLAIISDARFSGEGTPIVVERLLTITGEDAVTIDRKYLGAVTMRVPIRFMILTNELPKFNDASNALSGRCIIIRLTRSFYGHEDPDLTGKLCRELPGILKWAIEGWKRLRVRGYFVQPDSVREAIMQMEDLASPVAAFVRERCVVGPGYRESVDAIYTSYREWCQQEGRDHVLPKTMFGRDLASAIPGVLRRRGTIEPFYQGIAIQGARSET